MRRLLGKIALTMFALALATGAGFMDSWLAGRAIDQIRAEARLKPVTAEILWSRVATKPGRGSDTIYRSDIEYEYTVDGVTYRSSAVGSSRFVSDSDVINRIDAMFPSGRNVTAYYDPQDPSRAILLKGVGGDLAKWLLYSTNINCFAATFLLGAWRSWAALARQPAPEDVVVVRDGVRGLRVRPDAITMTEAACVYAVLGSMVIAMLTPLLLLPDQPLRRVPQVWISLAIVSLLLSFWVIKRRNGWWLGQLIIDREQRQLRAFPQPSPRNRIPGVWKDSATPFDDIGSVESHSVFLPTLAGAREFQRISLRLKSRPALVDVFVINSSAESGRSIAGWLQGQITAG